MNAAALVNAVLSVPHRAASALRLARNYRDAFTFWVGYDPDEPIAVVVT